MSFKDHLSDLKYYMSKDNTNGTRGTFIMLAVVWVLAIVLTIFMPIIWFVPVFKGVNIIIKLGATLGWVITLLFGIISWISVTKE